MSYRVEQEKVTRPSFGEYWYRIYDDEKLIARYWHDYRGDEHGIEFANGTKEGWPVGRMIDFLEGGGHRPVVLTRQAIAYIKGKLDAAA